MPRYIDEDSTIKAIRDKFNIYFEVPCDSDDRRAQEIIGKVKKVIQEQPTADVVSKSQYDLAVAEREANVKGFTEELVKAKFEVAIEILGEIDYTLLKFHCYEYEMVRRYIPPLLIELKKKYTEGIDDESTNT